MKQVSDATFENDVLKNEKPVLVDFWAEWCGPCRMLLPIIEELAEEMKDKVEIAKMNVDENPDTPAKFSIRGIPTLILFKKGEVIESKTGASSKDDLKAWIEKSI